jgi:hypothetical protein
VKKIKSVALEPMTEEIIDIPELHDRIIAGTALKAESKIITKEVLNEINDKQNQYKKLPQIFSNGQRTTDN